MHIPKPCSAKLFARDVELPLKATTPSRQEANVHPANDNSPVEWGCADGKTAKQAANLKCVGEPLDRSRLHNLRVNRGFLASLPPHNTAGGSRVETSTRPLGVNASIGHLRSPVAFTFRCHRYLALGVTVCAVFCSSFSQSLLFFVHTPAWVWLI